MSKEKTYIVSGLIENITKENTVSHIVVKDEEGKIYNLKTEKFYDLQVKEKVCFVVAANECDILEIVLNRKLLVGNKTMVYIACTIKTTYSFISWILFCVFSLIVINTIFDGTDGFFVSIFSLLFIPDLLSSNYIIGCLGIVVVYLIFRIIMNIRSINKNVKKGEYVIYNVKNISWFGKILYLLENL